MLAIIFSIAAVPLVAAFWAIAATTWPDLSDLVPIENISGNAQVLRWSTLLREPRTAVSWFGISAEAKVCALGYMTDGERAIANGEWVQDFVLLPEAGSLFHPAHRFGDQMIAVQLRKHLHIHFSALTLIWVSGTFHALPGSPGGSKPLYRLDAASVEAATRKDIERHFR